MKKATKIALVILILTAVGYLVSFLLPPPSSWVNQSLSFHTALANSVLYTLLHVGAAILFLVGISAYKEALRSAYTKIAIGIVLVGVGLAQVVFLNIFGLIQTAWVQYGGVMIPFVVAGVTIYFGTRSMAKLVGVKSPLMKLRVVIPLLVVSIIVVSLLPHGPSSLPELYFDIANGISVWDVVLYLSSLGLVLQMRSRIGAYYTSSMAWLSIGLIGSVIITFTVLIGTFVMGMEPEGALLDIIVIVGGLLYLKAGHTFAKTEEL